MKIHHIEANIGIYALSYHNVCFFQSQRCWPRPPGGSIPGDCPCLKMGGASAPVGGVHDDAQPGLPMMCQMPKGHLYGNVFKKVKTVPLGFKLSFMKYSGSLKLCCPNVMSCNCRKYSLTTCQVLIDIQSTSTQELTPFVLVLTVELDSQLVRGPSERNASGGG